MARRPAAGKFAVFDASFDPSRAYTLWAGVSAASRSRSRRTAPISFWSSGSSSARSAREASRGLILSGFIVFAQFIVFLLIGVMLFVYYQHTPLPQPLARTDEILPVFVVSALKHGLAGFIVAAIVAAAPLRVNMAGVIPVIFAASIMAFPPTVGQLSQASWAQDISAFFNPNGWAFVVGECFFILVFTYFYTAVTFNPVDQADNLKKYGGFIPGVRPGRPTAEYLDRILARLTFPGAIFLAAVAAMPDPALQPDERELLLRRYVDPDRDRRCARHREAARGAADDAQLRRLPEVGPRAR